MQAAEWWLDDSIGIETMLRAIDWWYWCYVDDVSKVCWAPWAALKTEMAGVAGRLNPIGSCSQCIVHADCLVLLALPLQYTVDCRALAGSILRLRIMIVRSTDVVRVWGADAISHSDQGSSGLLIGLPPRLNLCPKLSLRKKGTTASDKLMAFQG